MAAAREIYSDGGVGNVAASAHHGQRTSGGAGGAINEDTEGDGVDGAVNSNVGCERRWWRVNKL